MLELTIEEMIHAVLWTDAWNTCKGETVRSDANLDGAWEDYIREAYRDLLASMTHVFRVRDPMPGRYGHPCRILVCRKRAALIQFGDGVRVITRLLNLRRLKRG